MLGKYGCSGMGMTEPQQSSGPPPLAGTQSLGQLPSSQTQPPSLVLSAVPPFNFLAAIQASNHCSELNGDWVWLSPYQSERFYITLSHYKCNRNGPLLLACISARRLKVDVLMGNMSLYVCIKLGGEWVWLIVSK